jgi:hypothetical protein
MRHGGDWQSYPWTHANGCDIAFDPGAVRECLVSSREMLMDRPRIVHALAQTYSFDSSKSTRKCVMSDSELRKVVNKLSKLRALRQARDRVRQLELELCGESAKPEEPPQIPEFLSQREPLRAV